MDWAGLMRLGLKTLGLSPGVFWKLTPIELLVMLGADDIEQPLTRARLQDLVRAYPDTVKEDSHGA